MEGSLLRVEGIWSLRPWLAEETSRAVSEAGQGLCAEGTFGFGVGKTLCYGEISLERGGWTLWGVGSWSRWKSPLSERQEESNFSVSWQVCLLVLPAELIGIYISTLL